MSATVAAAAMPRPATNLQPDQQHAEQRQHDGDAGEHHGATGGVHRADRRLLGRGAGPGELAVAGDDEQRVVDTDAEADHDADQRCELRDREAVGEEADQSESAGTDAGDGDADRQTHRQHRTERQDQHHDRERESDQLGLGRFELAERGATDLDSDALDLGQQLVDLDADRRRLGVVDVVGEVELRERDRAVGVDLLCAERGVRADHRDAVDLGDVVEQRRHRLRRPRRARRRRRLWNTIWPPNALPAPGK